MNFNDSAITYALLVIPALFAFAVLAQGIGKITREEKDGPVAIVVGIFLLILIGASYFLFIR